MTDGLVNNTDLHRHVKTESGRSKTLRFSPGRAAWAHWAAFAIMLCGSCFGANCWGAEPFESDPPTEVSVRVERNVVYAERPDLKLLADLYHPAAKAHPEPTTETVTVPKGRVPGVLMVHGGAWMSGSKMQVAWHAMRLARRGYFVMAINYRLAPKYRHPAQIEDCRDALRWMYQHADQMGVDPKRFGAYGYSAGGHLVCLLGLSSTKDLEGEVPKAAAEATTDANDSPPEKQTVDDGVTVRCIVAGGAPCDFCRVPLDSPQLSFWLGGTRREMPDVYRLASPITYASSKAPPLFLFHGESDALVPGTGAERLRQALSDQGVTTQWHSVPKAGHLEAYVDGDAFDEGVKFFDRWLQATN